MLKTFEDVIRVRDIPLPQGLTARVDGDDIVAHVEAPRSEEELEKLDEAVEEDVTKVEVEKPEEKEEEAKAPAEEKTEKGTAS